MTVPFTEVLNLSTTIKTESNEANMLARLLIAAKSPRGGLSRHQFLDRVSGNEHPSLQQVGSLGWAQASVV